MTIQNCNILPDGTPSAFVSAQPGSMLFFTSISGQAGNLI